MEFKLREYQQKMVDDIMLSTDKKRILSVLPTGGGKSVVIASLINNTYTAIALIILVPIVIIASLVLVACREQLDTQTLILAVVGMIVLAVAVMVLLVVLPSLQIM